MLHSPNPITVQLHAKAFKRMENLKFLIVRNVHICEELKFLPNGLRLLECTGYHFSLPSKYCPQQLVAFGMPHSHIRLEKLFKQVWLLVSLNYDFLKFYFKICSRVILVFFTLYRSYGLKIWKVSISVNVIPLQI